MSFFESIVTIANERPVTAADFMPFIGQSNWLLVDADDLPKTGDAETDAMDMICDFKVQRIDKRENCVLIILPNIDGRDLKMRLDADELAIRMEAS